MTEQELVQIVVDKLGIGRDVAQQKVSRMSDVQRKLITKDSRAEQIMSFLNAPPEPAKIEHKDTVE